MALGINEAVRQEESRVATQNIEKLFVKPPGFSLHTHVYAMWWDFRI